MSSPTAPSSTNASAHATLVGWHSSGDDRGTIDILWSCGITIVLCCWVSTRPNAPTRKDNWRHSIIDKLNLAFIGLLGPDVLFGVAAGQLSSAMRAKKLFLSDPELLGGHEWSLRHSFFADMGGFVLTSPDYEDGFPIDAEQIYYLVKHGHLDFPALPHREIKDRDMADKLSRLIALWQACFFSVSELVRVGRHLPMTTLEVTTLSFSLTMIATSLCWFYKPQISRPVIIRTKDNRQVADIRDVASRTTHPSLTTLWYRTPLDFIAHKSFKINIIWHYMSSFSQILHLHIVSRPTPAAGQLWLHVPSDLWKPLEPALLPAGTVVLLGISISFMAAWNFSFPTMTEQYLWRVCSTIHFTFSMLAGAYYVYCEIHASFGRNKRQMQFNVRELIPSINAVATAAAVDAAAPVRQHVNEDKNLTIAVYNMPTLSVPHVEDAPSQSNIEDVFSSWRNISRDRNPEYTVSLRFMGPFAFGCLLYVVCRIILYIEDFAGLRLQPAGVYVAVNHFIPFMS